MADEKLKEGWTYLINSRKWHYFVEQKSLCKRFALFAKPTYEQGNDDSPDNCRGCMTALAKRHTNLDTEAILNNKEDE